VDPTHFKATLFFVYSDTVADQNYYFLCRRWTKMSPLKGWSMSIGITVFVDVPVRPTTVRPFLDEDNRFQLPVTKGSGYKSMSNMVRGLFHCLSSFSLVTEMILTPRLTYPTQLLLKGLEKMNDTTNGESLLRYQLALLRD
ncbi:hypothetical protein Tco_0327563, partial [Tanacetum coccineum]